MKRIAFAVCASALAASALADRAANQGWVERNFARRADVADEGRCALLFVDLNDETGGSWRSFELKASVDNFTGPMTFWAISDEADGYTEGTHRIMGSRPEDGMLVYELSAQLPGADGRAWTRLPSTLFHVGPNPRRYAVIVSPDLCADGGDWLRERNGEIVWSYARCDASGPECDDQGNVVWTPVQPAKWYLDLPAWADQ